MVRHATKAGERRERRQRVWHNLTRHLSGHKRVAVVSAVFLSIVGSTAAVAFVPARVVGLVSITNPDKPLASTYPDSSGASIGAPGPSAPGIATDNDETRNGTQLPDPGATPGEAPSTGTTDTPPMSGEVTDINGEFVSIRLDSILNPETLCRLQPGRTIEPTSSETAGDRILGEWNVALVRDEAWPQVPPDVVATPDATSCPGASLLVVTLSSGAERLQEVTGNDRRRAKLQLSPDGRNLGIDFTAAGSSPATPSRDPGPPQPTSSEPTTEAPSPYDAS